MANAPVFYYAVNQTPESVSSSGRMAQALDPSSCMKNLARPEGMAAIFHYAIRINILHSTLPLNPRIRVDRFSLDGSAAHV